MGPGQQLVSLNKIRADLNRPQALAERNEVWSGVVVIEDLSEERLRLLRDAPAPDGDCRHGVLLVPRICESSEDWAGCRRVPSHTLRQQLGGATDAGYVIGRRVRRLGASCTDYQYRVAEGCL